MSLLVSWVAFPIVLGLVSTGCGLAIERLSGHHLRGVLVPGLGLATIAVLGQFSTLAGATAGLTLPVVCAIALAGFLFALPGRLRLRDVDPWALACALGVFTVFAAPIILSGEATFAGYIRLDDTASWLALTDRALEDGATAAGLAPSTYEATLDFYLNSRYPLGGLVPLAVGQLVGEDYAWVWQPYLAFLAAMLAASLYSLASPLIRTHALRAGVAFVSAQAALVLGFALWGGFKEVGAACLVALLAALGPAAVREALRGRRLLPLALVSAGIIAFLSAGGAVWVIPAFLALVVAALRSHPRRLVLDQAAWLAGVTLVLTAPAVVAVSSLAGIVEPAQAPRNDLANLIAPLSSLQVFGIWPAGDFRLRPDALGTTHVLVLIAAVGVLVGLTWAIRRREWPLLLYMAVVSAGGLAVGVFASPWIAAKALTVASPAFVLAALLGAVWTARHANRAIGLVLGAVVVAGVLSSNLLAYSYVNLAPRERLAELAGINEAFRGDGPALLTEFEPYGARYFLRDLDPESAGELRRRPITPSERKAGWQGRVRRPRRAPPGRGHGLPNDRPASLAEHQSSSRALSTGLGWSTLRGVAEAGPDSGAGG